jgi:hypothetical protein
MIPVPYYHKISHGEFVSLRRHLLCRTLELLQPVMLAEVEPTFDDAIASFLLTSFGASDDEHHLRLLHWLNFCKFITRKVNLNIEPHGYNEEDKEERRRCVRFAGVTIRYLSHTLVNQAVKIVVAVYTIDRHTALSFNLRVQMADRECQQLQLPCPDEVWESPQPLEDVVQAFAVRESCGITYSVRGLDLFGIFLPPSR